MQVRSRSITRQTVTTVLLVQVVFALCLGSVTVWHQWHGRMHALDVQITGRTDSLLGAIQDAEDPEDNITLDPEELRVPRNDRYAVYSASGKLLGRSLLGSLLPQNGPTGMQSMEMEGQHYRVLRRGALRIIDRAENGGIGLRRPVVMVYGSPTTHVLHETIEGAGFTLALIAIFEILAALATAWLLRSTLQPIRDLALAAQRVSSSSLQFDQPQSAMEVVELRPLAVTLAELISNLHRTFAKEQRFMSDAAHELKTAVAVERSALQLLMLRRRNPDEYVAGLEQLLNDNERVEELVAKMLDLARMEQSSAESAPLLDFANAVQQACRTMRSIAEIQGVRLTIDADAGVFVRLQPDRAETLITNLLSNSIRHSTSGGVVSVVAKEKSDHISLEVIDRGSGIDAEALPHVFERFYRDDPSRSRISGGSGLGLAICKSIVTAAGGSLEIESTLGKGTRVTALFKKS